MDKILAGEYEEFLSNNRIKVNKYLNVVLWFFVITGPAIAFGVKGGVFPDVSYQTCIIISAMVVLLSGIHFLLFKKIPNSLFTCLFALTALDILIVYMDYSHVSIYLTWFFYNLINSI